MLAGSVARVVEAAARDVPGHLGDRGTPQHVAVDVLPPRVEVRLPLGQAVEQARWRSREGTPPTCRTDQATGSRGCTRPRRAGDRASRGQAWAASAPRRWRAARGSPGCPGRAAAAARHDVPFLVASGHGGRVVSKLASSGPDAHRASCANARENRSTVVRRRRPVGPFARERSAAARVVGDELDGRRHQPVRRPG